MRNLSIKLHRIYACYMNIMLYDVIYSIQYYPWFSVTAVGLETYYPRIRRSTCTCFFTVSIRHCVLYGGRYTSVFFLCAEEVNDNIWPYKELDMFSLPSFLKTQNGLLYHHPFTMYVHCTLFNHICIFTKFDFGH